MIVAGYGISIGALSSEFLSIGAVMMITTTLITTLLARFTSIRREKISD
jgi:hypothetical protein